MADMPTGDGLTAEASGFRFAPVESSLPTGQPASLQFRILGGDDKPVTAFEPDQTKLMHLYLIRSDLTGFQRAPTGPGPPRWPQPSRGPTGHTPRSSPQTPPAKRCR
jgi:hypothetical protein